MTLNGSSIALGFGSMRLCRRNTTSNDRLGPMGVPNESLGVVTAAWRLRLRTLGKRSSGLAHRSRLTRDRFRRSRLPTGALEMATGALDDRSMTANVPALTSRFFSPTSRFGKAAAELRVGPAEVREGTLGE